MEVSEEQVKKLVDAAVYAGAQSAMKFIGRPNRAKGTWKDVIRLYAQMAGITQKQAQHDLKCSFIVRARAARPDASPDR